MHEAGIIRAMLKTIEGIMERNHLTMLKKIVLQVGELSGVVPGYMESCFPAVVRRTRFRDAKLELEVIPGILRCRRCNLEFPGLQHNLICPTCGNRHDFQQLSGDGLIIKEIQGY